MTQWVISLFLLRSYLHLDLSTLLVFEFEKFVSALRLGSSDFRQDSDTMTVFHMSYIFVVQGFEPRSL